MVHNYLPVARTHVRGRLLFAATVCLLSWFVFCTAQPMDGGSSTPLFSNLARSLSDEYEASTGSHYLQQQVKVANQVHYRGYPVFNTEYVTPDQIREVAGHVGGAYAYSPKSRNRKTPFAAFQRRDPGAIRLSEQETGQLTERLLEAQSFEQQYGPQARSLKFGRPFAPLPPDVRVPHSWKDFWHSGSTYKHFLPLTQDAQKWPHLRDNVLQRTGRLLLIDQTNDKMYGFRLNNEGEVEMNVKKLNHDLLKRMRVSSSRHEGSSSRGVDTQGDASDETLEDTQDAAHELKKRGRPLPDWIIPSEPTLEYVLQGEHGLKPPASLQATPGGEDGLDQRYAHLLHIHDRPVFDVQATTVFDLQQALKDYDSIYVVGTKHGAPTETVVQLFRHSQQGPLDPAPNLQRLLSEIKKSRDFEESWGPQARALLNGRKIRRPHLPPGTEAPHMTFLVGPGPEPPNLHDLRSVLARSGTVTLVKAGTESGITLRLSPQGFARMVPSRRLAKRMQGTRLATDTLEYYKHLFTGNPTLARTPLHQMDEYYANVLHYQGIPVFYTADRPVEEARQALVDRGSCWLVGQQQLKPLEHIPVLRRIAGGGVQNEGDESFWAYLKEAERFGEEHGDVAKKLAFGAPFTMSRRFTRAYEPPHWNAVEGEAEALNSRTTSISFARSQLKTNHMLRLYDPNSHTSVGFRVNEDGTVQHKVFSASSRHLSKRMTPGETPQEYTPSEIRYYATPEFGDPDKKPLTQEQRGKFYADVLHYNGHPVFFPASDETVPDRAAQAHHDYDGFWVMGPHPSHPDKEAALFRGASGTISTMDDDLLKYVQARREFAAEHGELINSLVVGPDFPPAKQRKAFWQLRPDRYVTPSWDTVKTAARRVPAAELDLATARRLINKHRMLAITNGDRVYGFALNKQGKLLFEALEGFPHGLAKRMMRGGVSASEDPTLFAYYATHASYEHLPPLTPEQQREYYADVLHYKGEPVFFPKSDATVPERSMRALRDHGSFWVVSSRVYAPDEEAAMHIQASGQLTSSGEEELLRYVRATRRLAEDRGELTKALIGGPLFPERKERSGLRRKLPGGTYQAPSWSKVAKVARRVSSVETSLPDARRLLDQHNMLAVTHEDRVTLLALKKDGSVAYKFLEGIPHRLVKRMESASGASSSPDHFTYYVGGFVPEPRQANTGVGKGRYWAGVLHFNGYPVLVHHTTVDLRNKAHQASADYGGFHFVYKDGNSPPRLTSTFVNGRFPTVGGHADVLEGLQEMEEFGRTNGNVAKMLKYGPAFRPVHPVKKLLYRVPSWEQVRRNTQATRADTSPADMWKRLNSARKLVVTDGGETFGFALTKAGDLLHHKF